MPALLRQLRKKNKWSSDEPLPWLEGDNIPADPLENLATNSNVLSVYEVGEDQTKIERVASALAAACQRFSEFEYILFDQNIPSLARIKIEELVGETADEEVNFWHRDLVQISANKLVALAKFLVPNIEPDVILPKRMCELLAHSVVSGKIAMENVKIRGKDLEKLNAEINTVRARQ